MANKWREKWRRFRFHFLGFNADDEWGLKIKRCLLLGRKAMTNLDSVLESRDITVLTKVLIVNPMVFPLVTYRWKLDHKESWCWRIDAFELWCWRRLLRVLWTERTSKQSILKEINSEYSLEGLVLKLKLQYFGHLMQRSDSQGKTLMLGKTEGKRRRGRQRIRWLDGTQTQWTWVWARSGRQRRTGKPGVLQSMKSWRIRQGLVTEQQLSQRIIRLQRGQLKLAECPFYYMEPQMR